MSRCTGFVLLAVPAAIGAVGVAAIVDQNHVKYFLDLEPSDSRPSRRSTGGGGLEASHTRRDSCCLRRTTSLGAWARKPSNDCQMQNPFPVGDSIPAWREPPLVMAETRNGGINRFEKRYILRC